MTWHRGNVETGLAPRLWRYRAEWIPAYAGMTVRRAEWTASAGDTLKGRGATRPVSKPSPGPRHSRESGNLLESADGYVIPA